MPGGGGGCLEEFPFILIFFWGAPFEKYTIFQAPHER